ncbi:hypothetical protein QUF94_17200 [Peribacillus sp. NJ4]|nr:hypothetical protein [Peribacillus sp. NJ4]
MPYHSFVMVTHEIKKDTESAPILKIEEMKNSPDLIKDNSTPKDKGFLCD